MEPLFVGCVYKSAYSGRFQALNRKSKNQELGEGEWQGALGGAHGSTVQCFHLDSLPGAVSQSTTDGEPSMTET